MSAWDYEGRYTREEGDGTESDPSRSVLERWHLLNLMRPPSMTHAFYRILSVIAEVCPPGSYLKKSRGRLAENSGTSQANVKRFFLWAYGEGLMEREVGRRGFSDRPWPAYLAWFTHAAKTVAKMTDQDRRAKEVERLVAFGVALGGDEAWERKFRESMQATTTRVKLTPPRVSVTPPGVSMSPGVGSKQRGDQGQADPLEQVSNRTLEQKRRRERGNSPEPEQAPLRASRSSSLSGKPEKPKSTAREKQRAEILQFFRAEFSIGNGVKPLDVYARWFPPRYGREDIEWAYQAAAELQVGAT